MNETAKDILLALLHNPAIMQPVQSAINPKMGQIQIVVDVVGTAIAIAEDFEKRIDANNDNKKELSTSSIIT